MEATAEFQLKLPSPEVSEAEVAQLVSVLEAAGGWLTAKEIAALMGEGTTDRTVRQIASAACPVVVSFPGSRGYKLWKNCQVGEICHCIEAFESQGRDMMKRAVMYRQAYHRRFRGAPEAAETAGSR